VERLECLVSEVIKVPYTAGRVCLTELNEKLNELIFFLEAGGPETDKALLHIQACCWMLQEGRHTKTEEQQFLTFHYIKDKTQRACQILLLNKQGRRSAA
jgi:hypothetical protein